WMLETIREFALERLEQAGAAEELRRRYSAYFLELAELATPELRGPSSSVWLDRLEAEHDNVRAVLAEALENGRAALALRRGGAMWQFWYMRGHWSEGGRWLDSALAAAGAKSDPQIRIDALDGAGILALWQGNLERASAVADQRLALAAEPDFEQPRHRCGQPGRLRARAGALRREPGDRPGATGSGPPRTRVHESRHDDAEARRRPARSRAAARQSCRGA